MLCFFIVGPITVILYLTNHTSTFSTITAVKTKKNPRIEFEAFKKCKLSVQIHTTEVRLDHTETQLKHGTNILFSMCFKGLTFMMKQEHTCARWLRNLLVFIHCLCGFSCIFHSYLTGFSAENRKGKRHVDSLINTQTPLHWQCTFFFPVSTQTVESLLHSLIILAHVHVGKTTVNRLIVSSLGESVHEAHHSHQTKFLQSTMPPCWSLICHWDTLEQGTQ